MVNLNSTGLKAKLYGTHLSFLKCILQEMTSQIEELDRLLKTFPSAFTRTWDRLTKPVRLH